MARSSIAVLLLLSFPLSYAQQNDVTFFVIGKHGNYSQDATGQRTSIDYSFFSEIFLRSNGDAQDATLSFPTGELVEFRDMREVEGGSRDNIFLISGKDRFTSFDQLQERYPDGEYRVSFGTPSGDVSDGLLVFAERPLPDPPEIRVQQEAAAECRVLAPGKDVVVTWGDFARGRADKNGILDDLIFVILTDAEGERVAHSGRPFQGESYLTYANSRFTIDGAVLRPDEEYVLSVEHAILDDTTRFNGVPAFTTRAVTTKLELQTGSREMMRCEVGNQIDAGHSGALNGDS